MGALFGGGLLAWLSTFCSWEWLYCLWGSYYIVILILLVVNTQHYSQHAKRKEVPYKNRTTVEKYGSVLSNGADENEDINCEHEKFSDKQQVMFSSKSKTNKLEVVQILRNILQTPDFVWLVCCVLTYKLGEQGVASMLPLFLMDQGIPQEHVGVMSGVFGQAFSIAGSTVGGWIVSLHSGQR